jgi:mono/diheme cytochrome c family protein
MKKIVLTIVVASCLIAVVSCTYNKKELPEPIVIDNLMPNPPPGPNPTPNPSPEAITYTSHIKSVIDNNCIICHGHMGGVTLETYAQVKAQADAGRILARAINGSGNGPMPPSGLMAQTTLDTLQMWLDQGSPQ